MTWRRHAAIALLLMTALGIRVATLGAQEIPPARTAEKADAAKMDKNAADEGQDIDALKKTAPKVFIDGRDLDLNYIKTEIQFINYVRDRKEADVHVLITQQRTGGGGREYTLSFIGLGPHEDQKNELKYFSNRIDTPDEMRKGLVQILKLGLAPYVARTPISKIIVMNANGKMKSTAVEDKWNFWVFSLSARGRVSGEEARKSKSINGNFSVSRVTPQAKFRLGLSGSYDTSAFDYEDYSSVTSTKGWSSDLLFVKSLGEHWSVGGFANLSHSSYSNIDLSLSIHPAVEYDLFPYSQSTRRQLRILYRIGYNYDRYIDLTIYNKLKAATWKQVLTVTLNLIEPWGTAELSVEGSNYFLDSAWKFKIAPPWVYNRVNIQGGFALRLIKGLSLTIDGRCSALRDQLALAAGEASLEELLLRRRELASGYAYQLNVGLSYTFGSVYSNVVNPRFGGGFGGTSGGRGF